MDVFDAIRTLLAVRQYADRPVPEAVIRRVLEAGQLTASARNAQPWRFIVVDDRNTLRQLASLAPTGPYLAQAPVAIVVTIEPGPFGISDGSRAIQDMLLTAWDSGVGSNWVGFAGGLAAVKPVLGIPDTQDVLAILPFGYPSQPVGQGKKNRKPLSEVAFRGRYGQPFS
jgi:nitroreductase